MRQLWKCLLVLAVFALGAGSVAWASVPKVVLLEDFTAVG